MSLEFYVCDQVYLKISTMKGVMRFGRKGRLSLRCVGPYEILQRVVEVAYDLALTTELASVLPVLHVYILKKCLGNPASFYLFKVWGSRKSCLVRKFEILDRRTKSLRNKEIATIKVL